MFHLPFVLFASDMVEVQANGIKKVHQEKHLIQLQWDIWHIICVENMTQ